MKLSNLFHTTKEGIQAITLDEYIGWLLSDEGYQFYFKSVFYDCEIPVAAAHMDMVAKAHTFLTQEFREDMLIGENRLFAGEWSKTDSQVFHPKGDLIISNKQKTIEYYPRLRKLWIIYGCVFDINTLNDFIRESNKQKIKLYFNDIDI